MSLVQQEIVLKEQETIMKKKGFQEKKKIQLIKIIKSQIKI
jgi:hypothetical protein